RQASTLPDAGGADDTSGVDTLMIVEHRGARPAPVVGRAPRLVPWAPGRWTSGSGGARTPTPEPTDETNHPEREGQVERRHPERDLLDVGRAWRVASRPQLGGVEGIEPGANQPLRELRFRVWRGGARREVAPPGRERLIRPGGAARLQSEEFGKIGVR